VPRDGSAAGLTERDFVMRVLVVGATGVIGTRLVPLLAEHGHQVTGTSRSAAKAGHLRSLGAEPAVLDVLDAPAVRAVVGQARPDAIIYQSTALSGISFSRNMDRAFGPTNQLRTTGTDNLLAAAREAGVPRFIAQSFAPFRYAHTGGPVKDETDPLTEPPPSARLMFAAMAHNDQAVTGAGGIALRYGGFYGDHDNAMMTAIGKRQFPLIGDGGGIMSFIHLDDAAAATVLALDAAGPAVYNVTDDDPAPMREWLPALASALGAKPPYRVPAWVARLLMGKMLPMMTEARGASNAKAKKELGWTLRYPTWRDGFRAAYGR
jgi:nucleoside-diphosphate-sugar epimerase